MARIGIIGAGPAGVIAGSYLVKAGFDVTIYEKNSRTISTPCGEGISDIATAKLRKDTGFDSKPYFSSRVKGMKNFFPGGYYAVTYGEGSVLEREAWIDGIRRHFEKLGGTMVFDHRISNLDEMKEDIVVGAEGPISLVRSKIGGKVEACTAVQYKMKLDWKNRDLLEFYWDFETSDLYGWNFPKKDYFNVGICGNMKKLDRFCEKYNMHGEIIKKEGYTIPFNGSGIHADRYYLIGDSAGMANSFSKGGLASIVYASDILSTCIKNNTGELYEQKILTHPAFSREYILAMKSVLSLSQKDLEVIGKIANEKDMLNLPLDTKMQALRYPHLLSKLYGIIKVYKDVMQYAW